jgi:hypothetical protein
VKVAGGLQRHAGMADSGLCLIESEEVLRLRFWSQPLINKPFPGLACMRVVVWTNEIAPFAPIILSTVRGHQGGPGI